MQLRKTLQHLITDAPSSVTIFHAGLPNGHGYRKTQNYPGMPQELSILSPELPEFRISHPSSINHLARILQRNIKNVAADIRFLEQAGLIDTKKETSKEISPHVSYDKILLEIAV